MASDATNDYIAIVIELKMMVRSTDSGSSINSMGRGNENTTWI